MLGEAHGLVADADGVLDDGLEVVFCVAGAELPRVGVHRKGHGETWMSDVDGCDKGCRCEN